MLVPRRTAHRRGFTVIEVVVAAIVLAALMLWVTRGQGTAQGSAIATESRATATTQRAAVASFFDGIRQADPSMGDVVSFDAHHITYRERRALSAAFCSATPVAGGVLVRVRAEPTEFVRSEPSDSFYIAVNDSIPREIPVAVGSATPAPGCVGSSMSYQVLVPHAALGSSTVTEAEGRAVRVLRTITARLHPDATDPNSVQLRREFVWGKTEQVAGPLVDDAAFAFFDADGAATTDPSAVRMVHFTATARVTNISGVRTTLPPFTQTWRVTPLGPGRRLLSLGPVTDPRTPGVITVIAPDSVLAGDTLHLTHVLNGNWGAGMGVVPASMQWNVDGATANGVAAIAVPIPAGSPSRTLPITFTLTLERGDVLTASGSVRIVAGGGGPLGTLSISGPGRVTHLHPVAFMASWSPGPGGEAGLDPSSVSYTVDAPGVLGGFSWMLASVSVPVSTADSVLGSVRVFATTIGGRAVTAATSVWLVPNGPTPPPPPGACWLGGGPWAPHGFANVAFVFCDATVRARGITAIDGSGVSGPLAGSASGALSSWPGQPDYIGTLGAPDMCGIGLPGEYPAVASGNALVQTMDGSPPVPVPVTFSVCVPWR